MPRLVSLGQLPSLGRPCARKLAATSHTEFHDHERRSALTCSARARRDSLTHNGSVGGGWPDALSIRSWRDGDTLLFALYGELDIASGPLFEHQLQRAQADGPQRLVIDLSGLQFIDCVGLEALLRAHEHAREYGQQLRLLPGPPQTQRVFELTGTAELLGFHANER